MSNNFRPKTLDDDIEAFAEGIAASDTEIVKASAKALARRFLGNQERQTVALERIAAELVKQSKHLGI